MIKALIFLLVLTFVFLVYFFLNKSKKSSLFLLITISTLLIFFITGAFFLLNKDKTEKIYISPKFDGEKIIPGYFDEKN